MPAAVLSPAGQPDSALASARHAGPAVTAGATPAARTVTPWEKAWWSK